LYDLLKGVRVVEVALLATDTLGQHLADLGAEVIKIEQPPRGDYVRELGSTFAGSTSLMHLRWNRGKQSVAIDLKVPAGRDTFIALVKKSHVLIDGLRAGALDRLELGYETIKLLKPSLVYCSLSGVGRDGPYRRLATHGVFFDSFAGLAPPVYPNIDGIPRIPSDFTPVGMLAGGMYGAIGVLAALVRSISTGEGALIDVAEADAAASWVSDRVERAVNSFNVAALGGLGHGVRYSYYKTADERVILFQASEAKFWDNFCTGVGRLDLLQQFPSRPVGDHASGNETLRQELKQIFLTRSQADWVTFFIEHNVPGGPVHEADELATDPQFTARNMLYEVIHPEAGTLRLVSTPIKVVGEEFSVSPAPRMGQDTEAVLRRILSVSDLEIARLRSESAIL
jgi:crotonobetainyl-CoA:carnitine CoA-transferase CaiB-like acyl-CoA transferase